jgi:DNA polymerase-4
VHLRWLGDLGDWSNETTFHETQDTGFLLRQLARLFETLPSYKPLSVGITLLDLVPATQHQPDLFEGSERQDRLSPLVDGINRRFGRNTIGFGKAREDISRFTGHAAFQRVPEIWEF